MREVQVTLAGQELTLAATFGAASAIADKVGDPVRIARESNLEAEMLKVGVPYEPRWEFTVKNIPQILFCGLTAADSKMTLEDVQGLVFDAGFPAARDAAVEYLARIIGPKPESDIKGDDAPGE